MEVSPRVAEFIRAINAGVPPIEAQTPEAAREELSRRKARHSASTRPVAEAFDSVLDLADVGAADLRIRVYRDIVDGPGVIAYFHGGGWVVGDLESHDDIARDMATRTRRAVVSIDYPLAPEHPYPAAIESAFAAVAHLAREGAAVGLTGPIAVFGDSSGANVATAVALMSRDRGGPTIAAQALAYPVVDDNFDTESYLAYAEGYHLTRAAMRWYWNHYVGTVPAADGLYARPLRITDLSGLPDTLILTPEFDPLRTEGEMYARRLGDAGVAVTLLPCPGMFHGFLLFGDQFAEARAARAACAEFLRDRLP